MGANARDYKYTAPTLSSFQLDQSEPKRMEACGRIESAVSCSFHLRRDEGFRKLSARPRRIYVGGGGEEFADNGHLRYYTPRVRCGAKLVEDKRRKIMNKLSKELTALVCLEKEEEERSQDVAAEIGNKEMADVLLAQLEELRAKDTMMEEEEKAMKKKKKEEKAMKKMMKKKEKGKMGMKKMQKDCKDEDMSSSSSSESSESSDSECDEVVNISSMTARKLVEGKQSMPCATIVPAVMFENHSTQQIIEQKTNVTALLNHPSEGCETSHTSVFNITRPEGGLVVTIPAATTMPMNRIEVCMGGKCKKSGALQLKEEFERIVGNEGAVVGCKCMGKCKEGPNVRVVNQYTEVETSMPSPRNPLCIGVGLEDVGNIMASYFGKNDMGLLST